MKQREMTNTTCFKPNLFQTRQRSGLHSENACNYFWTKLGKMQSTLPVAATPPTLVSHLLQSSKGYGKVTVGTRNFVATNCCQFSSWQKV